MIPILFNRGVFERSENRTLSPFPLYIYISNAALLRSIPLFLHFERFAESAKRVEGCHHASHCGAKCRLLFLCAGERHLQWRRKLSGRNVDTVLGYLSFVLIWNAARRAVSRRIITRSTKKERVDRRILCPWRGHEFNWKLVITVITSPSSKLEIGRLYWGKKSLISRSVSIVVRE